MSDPVPDSSSVAASEVPASEPIIAQEESEEQNENENPTEAEPEAAQEDNENDDDGAADDDSAVPQSKRGRKRLKAREFFELEAEVSSDEEVSADEEEEDEEGLIADEVEDLIADEEEERNYQKRKREEEAEEHADVEVDEEDLELLAENTGMRVVKSLDTDIDQDAEDGGEKKGLKRLKKAKVSAPIFMPIEKTEKEKSKSAAPGTKKKRVEEGDEPDLNDYFNDEGEAEEAEEDEMPEDEQGEGAQQSQQQEQRSARKPSSQLKALEALFGSVRDFFMDRDEDGESDEYLSEEEEFAEEQESKAKTRISAAELAQQVHQRIRTTDIPERLQHRLANRSSQFSSLSELEQLAELDREANWIYEQAFRGDKSEREILPLIAKILKYIRMEHLEIPFIATYRREYYTGKDPRTSFTEDELWKIDELDEKYGEMSLRREKLSYLLEKLAPEDEEASRLLNQELSGQQDLDDVQDYVKFLSTVRGIGPEAEKPAEEAKEEEKTNDLEKAMEVDGERPQDENAEDEPELDFSKSSVRKAPAPTPATVRVKRAEFSLARVGPEFGLDRLADRLCISARQLGENLKLNFRKHEPIDSPFHLEEESVSLISTRFPTSEAVACGVKSFAALRIGVDPIVRRAIRRIFIEKSEVSTKPTSKGVREIDSDSHDFWAVKRIERKPISAFARNPAQYFLIQRAQKEGFITIEFTFQARNTVVDQFADAFSEPEKNPVLAALQEMYLSTARHESAKALNAVRREVLQEAFKLYLDKVGQSELRSHLQKNASEAIIRAAGQKFHHLLTAGGFQPPAPMGKSEESRSKNFKIISCCMGATDEPSSFAVLNRYGFVQEVAVLHFLKSRAAAVGRDGQALGEAERLQYKRKQDDFNKFIGMVTAHKPSLIVIDASQLEAREFKAEIEKRVVIDLPSVRVELMDPTVARIFMNSARSEIEFKEHSKHLRLAISLGRRALDPIAEFCGIWQGSEMLAEDNEALISAGLLGPDGKAIDRSAAVAAATNPLKNDILALQLHSLQSCVSASHLLRALNRCLVRVVNFVGVDVNKIASRSWLSGPLQFVCGLGPIKAKHLLDHVKRHGHLPSRQDLILQDSASEPALLGPVVFCNSAGFLKVTMTTAMKDLQVADYSLLDETRIHPERYDLAFTIVRESLDIEEDAEEEKEEEEEEVNDRGRRKRRDTPTDRLKRKNAEYVAQLMHPDSIARLDQLDLETFAEMSRQANGQPILDTLLMIKQELKNPFSIEKMIRPFMPPTAEELFFLLINESPRTLHEGLMINVQVNRIAPRGAHVRLENGILGFLPVIKVSDNPPDRDMDTDQKFAWLKERLRVGQVLPARIMKIEPDRCSVEVSTTSRDLSRWDPRDRRSTPSEEEKIYMVDHYSNTKEHKDDKLLLFGGRAIKKSKFIPRNITHPMFRNIDRNDAVQDLAKKTPGEFLFRPSSKGTDRINITWKVYEDIYSDIEVTESSKPNPMELGSTLSIGDQQFEDLDEIVERFMGRVARFADQMINHKNFRLGDASEIEAILRAEKSQFPRKIPYTISFGLESGQSFRAFIFSYLPNHTIHTYKIYLSGEGFVFNGKKFKTPDQTIGAIKLFFSKPAGQARPPAGQAPSGYPGAAPMRQPVPAPYGAPPAAYPPPAYPPAAPYGYAPAPAPPAPAPRSRWGAAPAPAPMPPTYPPGYGAPYGGAPAYPPVSAPAPYYPPPSAPVPQRDYDRSRYAASSAPPPSAQFRVSERVSVYWQDRWCDGQVIGLPSGPSGDYTIVFEGQYRPTHTPVTVAANMLKPKW